MDLHAFLKNNKDLDLPTIRSLWNQMLRILRVVHDRRIVHCDLKPANFVLVKGRLKLIDFGISKRIQSDLTTSIVNTMQQGTVNYMAPETLIHNTSDRSSNKVNSVFSLVR